jgi:prepilin-type N-terminal cleavage/methylation domain-containing protein
MMWAKQKTTGFTIVELLIVIVVIAILAAITVVAFTGVQDKARSSAVANDFNSNNKVIRVASASSGTSPTTADILQSSVKMVAAQNTYKLATFCGSTQSYALAVETTKGDKYYSVNGGTVTQDNALDVTNACNGLGIASADRIFLGMPTSSCATENGTCTFSGTASIAYGSLAMGRFFAKKDLSSPVSCSNAFFGDPASGYGKACYILTY